MIRGILALSAFCLALSAQAVDGCVDKKGNDIFNQPEVFQKLISESSTCDEAAGLAKACAWGSSLDVASTAFAYMVCQKELKTMNPPVYAMQAVKGMQAACTARYKNEKGSMYVSAASYCNLSAIEWVLDHIAWSEDI